MMMTSNKTSCDYGNSVSAVCNMKPLAVYLNFPGGLLVEEAAAGDSRHQVDPGWEILGEMYPTLVFLPRKPRGREGQRRDRTGKSGG